jgi:transposase-like protein
MLAHRGIEASYETVRCWTTKFGRQNCGKPQRTAQGAIAKVALG